MTMTMTMIAHSLERMQPSATLGHMRLSYAASMDDLRAALDRIEAFCAGCA